MNEDTSPTSVETPMVPVEEPFFTRQRKMIFAVSGSILLVIILTIVLVATGDKNGDFRGLTSPFSKPPPSARSTSRKNPFAVVYRTVTGWSVVRKVLTTVVSLTLLLAIAAAIVYVGYFATVKKHFDETVTEDPTSDKEPAEQEEQKQEEQSQVRQIIGLIVTIIVAIVVIVGLSEWISRRKQPAKVAAKTPLPNNPTGGKRLDPVTVTTTTTTISTVAPSTPATSPTMIGPTSSVHPVEEIIPTVITRTEGTPTVSTAQPGPTDANPPPPPPTTTTATHVATELTKKEKMETEKPANKVTPNKKEKDTKVVLSPLVLTMPTTMSGELKTTDAADKRAKPTDSAEPMKPRVTELPIEMPTVETTKTETPKVPPAELVETPHPPAPVIAKPASPKAKPPKTPLEEEYETLRRIVSFKLKNPQTHEDRSEAIELSVSKKKEYIIFPKDATLYQICEHINVKWNKNNKDPLIFVPFYNGNFVWDFLKITDFNKKLVKFVAMNMNQFDKIDKQEKKIGWLKLLDGNISATGIIGDCIRNSTFTENIYNTFDYTHPEDF